MGTEQSNKFGTYERTYEVWFVTEAQQTAERLGYKRPGDAIGQHVEGTHSVKRRVRTKQSNQFGTYERRGLVSGK
jgi:hypothetical protein